MYTHVFFTKNIKLRQGGNQLIFFGRWQNDATLLYLTTKHVYQFFEGNWPVDPWLRA